MQLVVSMSSLAVSYKNIENADITQYLPFS